MARMPALSTLIRIMTRRIGIVISAGSSLVVMLGQSPRLVRANMPTQHSAVAEAKHWGNISDEKIRQFV